MYKKVFKGYRKKKSSKTLLKKSFEYNFGEQDQVDLLSTTPVLKKTLHIYKWVKHLSERFFISGYPFVATTGWLNMLINFNHNIDISYHVETG